MNQRRLPIQLVETRGEQDQFLKEAGGDNSLPKWSTPQSMREHTRIMTDTLSAVERIFDSREEDGLPVLMVATLDEKAVRRKAFRANARSIFDSRHKRNVLGKSSRQGLLVKVDSKADALTMKNNINLAGNISKDKQCGVAVIDDLQLFQPYVEEDKYGKPLKMATAKAVLDAIAKDPDSMEYRRTRDFYEFLKSSINHYDELFVVHYGY